MRDDDTLTGLDKAGRVRQHHGGRPVFSGRGAIFHLNARTGSRSKGQSARAAAAYIQREAEYSRDQADELVYAESAHMPSWADAEPTGLLGRGRSLRAGQRAAVQAGGSGPARGADHRRAAGAGGGLCPLPDRRRAAALHPGDPRWRGDQPALSPAHQRADQRRAGALA